MDKMQSRSTFVLFDMEANRHKQLGVSSLQLETLLCAFNVKPLDLVACILMPLDAESSVHMSHKLLQWAKTSGTHVRQIAVHGGAVQGGAVVQMCMLLGAGNGGAPEGSMQTRVFSSEPFKTAFVQADGTLGQGPRGANGHLLWEVAKKKYHLSVCEAAGVWPGEKTDCMLVLEPDPCFTESLAQQYAGYIGLACYADSPAKEPWFQQVGTASSPEQLDASVTCEANRELMPVLEQLTRKYLEMHAGLPDFPPMPTMTGPVFELSKSFHSFVLPGHDPEQSASFGQPWMNPKVPEPPLPPDLCWAQEAHQCDVLLAPSRWCDTKALVLAHDVSAEEICIEWTAPWLRQQDVPEDLPAGTKTLHLRLAGNQNMVAWPTFLAPFLGLQKIFL